MQTYAVVAQSNGKTLYGTTHVGNPLGWNDNFVINMKDLEYDDLMLAAFVNDDELGYANLSLMDISSTAAGNLDCTHALTLSRTPYQTGTQRQGDRKLASQHPKNAQVGDHRRPAPAHHHSTLWRRLHRGEGHREGRCFEVEFLQLHGREGEGLGVLPLQVQEQN